MEQNNQSRLNTIDHIAEGVEAKQDLLIGYTQDVIQKTAIIARELGVPQDYIRRWMKDREAQYISRISHVHSLISRTYKQNKQ